MRIAYISYEHPLGIAGGGIGTYIDQIASLMIQRNHDVELFSATATNRYECVFTNHYKLHLIPAVSQKDFGEQAAKAFALVQQNNPFDLIEGAEYGANTLLIKKRFPDIPLVIKLHTPSFFVNRLNYVEPALFSKLRYIISGMLKMESPKPYWRVTNEIEDPERELYHLADTISSPSSSLAEIVRTEWGEKEIAILANPFPLTPLMPRSHKNSEDRIRILFIGRLERRKGIYDLAKSIPMILKQNPSITFGFAGRDHPSIKAGMTTKAYLQRYLIPYSGHLEFFGLLRRDELNDRLRETDICIFPSLWENFPNVCMEAMLAEKAVIASKNGGMSDMISHLKNGYLISPNSPEEIATAILELSANHDLRLKLASAAREHILTKYDATIIGLETELLYLQTLNKKK